MNSVCVAVVENNFVRCDPLSGGKSDRVLHFLFRHPNELLT